VRPAITPTIGFCGPTLGFVVLQDTALASFFGADPPIAPISPIMMLDLVFSSATNSSRIALNSVPLTGSPPLPTADSGRDRPSRSLKYRLIRSTCRTRQDADHLPFLKMFAGIK